MATSFFTFWTLHPASQVTGARDQIASHYARAAEELEKLSDSAGADRLLTLLELAQRTSTSREDPYKDEIQCRVMHVNLVTELFRIMNITHDSQVSSCGYFVHGRLTSTHGL